MSKTLTDWDSRLGRRLKLRDLHILSVVVERGSMAKAAKQLRMAQPSISEAVANLEAALNVRLLDRSQRGVLPTVYARTLLRRSDIVFDELRQGLKEIEFLADPTRGEVRLGCPETLAGLVSTVIDQMSRRYPQIAVHVVPTEPLMLQLGGLRERSADLLVGRLAKALMDDDIATEPLFDDGLFVVAGAAHPLSRRRKIELSELTGERWILSPQNNLLMPLVAEAFRAKGLSTPVASVTTISVHVRSQLLATGRFLAIMPGSGLQQNAQRWQLRALPVDLGVRMPPVGILTLKNRTISPAAALFIEQARAHARTMRG
ncbi:MAG TPA: LysR family transcriptional regulator [Pseudolabrys sp.]|nr:LysR family transcriptional regulator [Pseudolabrys sp.]